MKNTHHMEIVGEGGEHRTLFLPEAAARGREERREEGRKKASGPSRPVFQLTGIDTGSI